MEKELTKESLMAAFKNACLDDNNMRSQDGGPLGLMWHVFDKNMGMLRITKSSPVINHISVYPDAVHEAVMAGVVILGEPTHFEISSDEYSDLEKIFKGEDSALKIIRD